MTARLNLRATVTGGLAIVAVAMAALASGCSSKASRPDEATLADKARTRAVIVVTQFGVDTGVLDDTNLGPGILKGGVVTEGADLEAWWTTGQNFPVAPTSRTRRQDEVTAVADVLRHLAELRPSGGTVWTPDQAARAAVAKQSLDAGYTDPAAFGGAPIVPGPALDAWYAAHSTSPLNGHTGPTVADEVARILPEITAGY